MDLVAQAHSSSYETVRSLGNKALFIVAEGGSAPSRVLETVALTQENWSLPVRKAGSKALLLVARAGKSRDLVVATADLALAGKYRDIIDPALEAVRLSRE